MIERRRSRTFRLVMIISGLMVLTSALAVATFFLLGQSELNLIEERVATVDAKQKSMELHRLEDGLAALAQTPASVEAYEALDAGYRAYIPEHLRDLYVALNPSRGEDLSLLSDPRDGSKYSQAHALHHPWMRRFAELKGWSDLQFVRNDGHVIYSVHKGRAFATAVTEGDDELAIRHLASVVQHVIHGRDGLVQASAEHTSLLGRRQRHVAARIISPEGQTLGAMVASQEIRSGTAPAGLSDWASGLSRKWKRVSALVAASCLATELLLFCGIFWVTRPRRAESGEGLPLIPMEQPSRLPEESSGPGSYRSGTRPTLAHRESKDEVGIKTHATGGS